MKRKLMIIMCAVMCLSMLLLTGCGSGGSGEGSGAEATSGNGSSEVEYPITVEDNDYFTFEITGYDKSWGEHKYKITNKTDKDISFDGEKAVINGDNTVDALIYCDLAAGTSGKESFYLDDDQMSDYEDGQEITMTIQYTVYDEEDYDEITSGSFDYVFEK